MNLELGSKGTRVKLLQEALKKLNLGLISIDGKFGPKTEFIVEKFQKSRKILVDGIVGAGTVHEIDAVLTSAGFTESGLKAISSSSSLVERQKKLRWIKCPADIFPGRGGYGSLTHRVDTAAAYQDL